MNFIALLILLVLLVLGIFVLANWALLSAPTTLSLVATSIEAPVGLVLLSATLLVLVLVALYVVTLRTSQLMETRRFTREMQTQREIADKAEASRLAELQQLVERELARLHQRIDTDEQKALARSQALEQNLRTALADSTNSLAACVGEVEDKIDRQWPGATPRLAP